MFESVREFLAKYNISLWSTAESKPKEVKRLYFDFSEAGWNRLVELSEAADQTPQAFAIDAMRESMLFRDLLATAKAQGHDLVVGVIHEDGSAEEIPLFKAQ
ncbi:MAG: hypothetical protein V4690_00710 [Patescibacteria group bacterium]